MNGILRSGRKGPGDRFDVGVRGGMVQVTFQEHKPGCLGDVEATGRNGSGNEHLILEVCQQT